MENTQRTLAAEVRQRLRHHELQCSSSTDIFFGAQRAQQCSLHAGTPAKPFSVSFTATKEVLVVYGMDGVGLVDPLSVVPPAALKLAIHLGGEFGQIDRPLAAFGCSSTWHHLGDLLGDVHLRLASLILLAGRRPSGGQRSHLT